MQHRQSMVTADQMPCASSVAGVSVGTLLPTTCKLFFFLGGILVNVVGVAHPLTAWCNVTQTSTIYPHVVYPHVVYPHLFELALLSVPLVCVFLRLCAVYPLVRPACPSLKLSACALLKSAF